MNTKIKISLIIFFCLMLNQTASASPWAKKEGYFEKTGGKFTHGLKHSLFSWMIWWTESREKNYKNQWEGFSAGIGKSVVYTAGGLIQLATFPAPLDFPNFGIGLHIPGKQCPNRHDENYTPPAPDPAGRKEASQKALKQASEKPKTELKPLTSPSGIAAERKMKTVGSQIESEKIKSNPSEANAQSASEEAEKAQEEALAQALHLQSKAAASGHTITSKLHSPTISDEQLKDVPEFQSSEDIISVEPQKTEDEETLWDDKENFEEDALSIP